MSNHKTCGATSDVICSLELAAGISPLPWPDGKGPSGRAPAPASRSASRASTKAKRTPDTSGLSSIGSSTSAALELSLASRLRAQMGCDGSMEYSLTWKDRVTPAGRRICALRASARRTSGSDCTGWPTPTADRVGNRVDTTISGDGRTTPNKLGWAVSLAGWTTPQSRDAKGVTQNFCRSDKPKDDSLCDQVVGLTSSWPPAGTSGIGGSVLNPAMSRWLMGFPQENPIRGWDTCSPGYESWATAQGLLAEYCARPAVTA